MNCLLPLAAWFYRASLWFVPYHIISNGDNEVWIRNEDTHYEIRFFYNDRVVDTWLTLELSGEDMLLIYRFCRLI